MGLVVTSFLGGIMKYSPLVMKNQIDDNNFIFKKKFGQNFIIDENIINSIVGKIDIDDDTLVIEVGPGAGSLTTKLASKAKRVMAYEIDTTLEDILKENLSDCNNVEVKFEDFLKADIKTKLKDYDYKKLYFVANLPYYITTPIIMKLIDDKILIDKIVVMVQKEVGDRFSAKIGSKDYGSLTVFLNYYFDIYKLIDVSRNVFMPKPNVDSVVVCFERKPKIYNLKNEDLFFKLVKDSFVQKRKTLRNNLKGYDLEKIEEILKKYDLDLSVRAENITIEMFIDIANNL